MTVAKNDRINMRVPQATKLTWVEFARKQGYSNLTDAVTDGMTMLMAAVGGKEEFELVKAPPKNTVIEPVPLKEKIVKTRAAREACPAEQHHRKGVYCKGCRRVI